MADGQSTDAIPGSRAVLVPARIKKGASGWGWKP